MTQQEAIAKFMKHWGSNRTKSYDFRQQYNDTFAEVDSFVRGEQWNIAHNRPTWLSTPVTNFLHVIKNFKVAAITETEIDIRIKPLFKDDIKSAEMMEGLIKSFWNVKTMNDKLIDVKENSRVFPSGFLQVSFDTSKIVGTKNNLRKGDFGFDSVSPTEMYWDPKGYKEEEMQYMYRTHTVTMADIKNTAGYNQEVVDDIKEFYKSTDNQEAGEVLNRNYAWQDKDRTFTLFEISFRWKSSVGSDYKYGTIHTISQGSTEKTDKHGDKMKSGDTDIEMTPLYYKADLGLDRHYFISLKEYNQPHEFMGKSTVQLVLDNQKQINKIDSIVANIATQAQNTQKIISADSGIDPQVLAKYGNAPGAIFVSKGDIDKSVRYMDSAKMPTEVIAYRQTVKDDMKEIANMNSSATGKGTHSLNSSQGVSTLVNQSNAMEVTPQALYSAFLTKIVKIMHRYIIKNYKSVERRLDISDPDSENEYVFLNTEMELFKDKEFDIGVSVLMTAQQKAIRKQEAMRIFELQTAAGKTIISDPTLIKMLGFTDEDRVLDSYYTINGKANEEKALLAAQTAAAKVVETVVTGMQGGELDQITLENAVSVAATEAVEQVFGDAKTRGVEETAQQGQPAQASGANAAQPAQMAAMEGGQ